MKITHGQKHKTLRKKWCAECAQWVGFNQWPKHGREHEQFPRAQKFTDEKLHSLSPTSVLSWGSETAQPDYQKLYEETNKKLHEAQMYAKKLEHVKRENDQLRRAMSELGRTLVTTYAEY